MNIITLYKDSIIYKGIGSKLFINNFTSFFNNENDAKSFSFNYFLNSSNFIKVKLPIFASKNRV